ncbi:hypothetical protein C8R45DRAFT_931599 [Mycena sanguinolenta]|nr:hypothetical protein C8R45DRAFT_931599 [Mycena sanguinolenta]
MVRTKRTAPKAAEEAKPTTSQKLKARDATGGAVPHKQLHAMHASKCDNSEGHAPVPDYDSVPSVPMLELVPALGVIDFLRDGGHIVMCSQSSCEIGVCTKCLHLEDQNLSLWTEFVCPLHHTTAEAARKAADQVAYKPVPYQGFAERQDGVTLGLPGGILAHSTAAMNPRQSVLLLVYVFEGFSLKDIPIPGFLALLEMRIPKGFAYVEVRFNLNTNVSTLSAANKALEHSLRNGQLKSSVNAIQGVQNTLPQTLEISIMHPVILQLPQ